MEWNRGMRRCKNAEHVYCNDEIERRKKKHWEFADMNSGYVSSVNIKSY